MSRLPGLSLILGIPAYAPLNLGLSLACAAASLARPVRLFLHGDTVTLLCPTLPPALLPPSDNAQAPTLGTLWHMAHEMGVALHVCQTGLSAHGLRADNLPDHIMPTGLVAFLAAAGDDQILPG